MKTNNVLLGLLAGVAIGAVIGIMLAPDKGSETRKKFVRKGEDLADDLREKFEDLLGGLGGKKEHSKNNGSTAEE
jgi:gas vesicle protein